MTAAEKSRISELENRVEHLEHDLADLRDLGVFELLKALHEKKIRLVPVAADDSN